VGVVSNQQKKHRQNGGSVMCLCGKTITQWNLLPWLVGREYPRSDTSFLSPAEATHTPMAPKNCGMKFKVDYGTN
jgi:hypothetical protein